MTALFILSVCSQFDFVLKMISYLTQHQVNQKNHNYFYSKVDESLDG